jgi:hypothetical protein
MPRLSQTPNQRVRIKTIRSKTNIPRLKDAEVVTREDPLGRDTIKIPTPMTMRQRPNLRARETARVSASKRPRELEARLPRCQRRLQPRREARREESPTRRRIERPLIRSLLTPMTRRSPTQKRPLKRPLAVMRMLTALTMMRSIMTTSDTRDLTDTEEVDTPIKMTMTTSIEMPQSHTLRLELLESIMRTTLISIIMTGTVRTRGRTDMTMMMRGTNPGEDPDTTTVSTLATMIMRMSAVGLDTTKVTMTAILTTWTERSRASRECSRDPSTTRKRSLKRKSPRMRSPRRKKKTRSESSN